MRQDIDDTTKSYCLFNYFMSQPTRLISHSTNDNGLND